MSTALPRADAAGFARVYEHHHQALYRYCRSILRHEQDAQDALQSAMMRAFVALQTERRELEMRPWLFRIAHNESINILRRRNRIGELDETLGDLATLEDHVADRETLRLLRRDLADLPERQRHALVLRELNGLGHEEIAAVLGTSPAAVKQAIFEGRCALLRCREGRDQACGEIQRLLSDGDGRILRSRPVRAHLRACAGCREFRIALGRRPRELAALLPPLPGGAAAALLRGLFDGPAATVASGGLATGLAAKAAIVVAFAGGGGAVALHEHGAVAQRAAGPAVSTPAGQVLPATAYAEPHRATPPAQPRPASGPPAHTVTTPAAKPAPTALSPGQTKQRKSVAPPVQTPASPSAHTDTRTGPFPPDHTDRQKPATPPAHPHAQKPTAPPGQAKKPANPPGQVKNQADGGLPPGQVKKQANGGLPPGQAKQEASGGAPPGQARKVAPQAAPAPTAPPVQANAVVPPGQAKKDAAAIAPAPEPPATVPPGQAKQDAAAPGTDK